MFQGFEPPTENWSKLPHQFVNALPLISTKGELQVILYVLRHTWGFQDDRKRITLDEFEHGRKRKDGTRMDSGCGASRPAIVKGIQRAVDHGFLVVEKEGDPARQRHYYRLRNVTTEVKECNHGSNDSLPRSEKDTIRKKPQKDNGADKPRNTSHPAIKAYRSGAHLYPVSSWRGKVIEMVGSTPDALQFWGRIVKAWVGMGWNPKNVKGMLECFEKKEIPGETTRTYKRDSAAPQQSTDPRAPGYVIPVIELAGEGESVLDDL